MTEAKQKLEHEYMSPEMVRFYMALGTLNSNFISRIIKDPGVVDKLTDRIIACTTHDEECGAGHVYDHSRNVCINTDMPIND